MLSVSLDCLFLIAPSVFSNFYLLSWIVTLHIDIDYINCYKKYNFSFYSRQHCSFDVFLLMKNLVGAIKIKQNKWLDIRCYKKCRKWKQTCALYPRRIVLIESYITLRMGIVQDRTTIKLNINLWRWRKMVLVIRFCFSKLTIVSLQCLLLTLYII